MTKEATKEATETTREIGRSEPCPCGSRKKYKRCCGVNALGIQSAPKQAPPQLPEGFDPNSLDPDMMKQMTEAFKRLPRARMSQLQSLMQRAMSGEDVSREMEVFQRTLPPDLQAMLSQAETSSVSTEPTQEIASGSDSDAPQKKGFWNRWRRK